MAGNNVTVTTVYHRYNFLKSPLLYCRKQPPMKKTCLFVFSILIFISSFAQGLQPGFNKEEYSELLKISARNIDTPHVNKIPAPQHFTLVYRSPVMGLDNRWDLWTNHQGTAVISIRGTTGKDISWLENFYAAMVPAKGRLQLSQNNTFDYHLAGNDKAAVHAGWLVGMAFLAKDIVPKIDSCYKAGITSFLIMGHSQGGAIAYLLTSYLHNLQQQKILAPAIIFKTYCSAAPKPGNQYYAYEYEAATQNGWAYNVVNSADWVPQTPVSVQTLKDFNTTNPFVNAAGAISKIKFPKNLALRHVYNKLNKSTLKAQQQYQKYLGRFAARQVKKTLPGYKAPDYIASNQYVRTGNTIVLLADDGYFKKFPDSKKDVFIHHGFLPYLYLTEKLP